MRMAQTIRVTQQVMRPQYVLGFVMGFAPEFVNMLTGEDLLIMGFEEAELRSRKLLQ